MLGLPGLGKIFEKHRNKVGVELQGHNGGILQGLNDMLGVVPADKGGQTRGRHCHRITLFPMKP